MSSFKNYFKRFCLSMLLITILLILSPRSSVYAHETHLNQEMIDIIIEYIHDIPDEEDLPESFTNIRSSKTLLSQAITVPAESVKKIPGHENVKNVRYNQPITLSQSDQGSKQTSQYPWNLESIGAPTAWEEGIDGSGVRIAILDTGFHTDHPSLSFEGGTSLFEDDPWTNDHTGHGTHVAGIIGASQSSSHPGVAPGASLYGVKVYHQDEVTDEGIPTTDVFELTEGIYEAISFNPHIIVISSGFPGGDQALYQAIKSATDQGILVVTASGNGKSVVDYPAAYPETISVTSIDQSSQAAGDIVPGGENELTAPGVGITSTSSPNSPYGYPYATMSGSSQATPHVAGVAALLMQKYGIRGNQVKDLLHENAKHLGSEDLFGYGLVQYKTQPSDDEEDEDEDDQNSKQTEEDETKENQDSVVTEKKASKKEKRGNNPVDSGNDKSDDDNPDDDLDEEEEKEEPSEEENIKTQSTLWITPKVTDSQATINDEDLEYISDKGTLALTLTDDLPENNKLLLTADQVNEIRERDLSILITKNDWEWMIPSQNLIADEAVFNYLPVADGPNLDLAQSSLVQVEIMQAGEIQRDLPESMPFRFLFDGKNAHENFAIYQLNESDDPEEANSWEELSSDRYDIYMESFLTNPIILGAFDRDQMTQRQAQEENEEDDLSSEETSEDSEQENDQDSQVESKTLAKNQTKDFGLKLTIGLLIGIAIFALGFFAFKKFRN